MKITNPTNNEISIQFKGVVYTIPALGSISRVAEEVATYWKTMVHEFIQVSEDEVVSTKEDKLDKLEEYKEMPQAEVEVIKGKPIIKSTKK